MSTTKKKTTDIAPVAGDNAVAVKRDIDVITAEINFYKTQVVEASWEIGQRLNEAKEQLEHGEWLGWLEDKVDFSEGTAQRFMRLAREYPKTSPVMELGSSKALTLLTLPAADRDEFMDEKHVVDGEEKSVPDMSKRELEKAVKERSEALKAQKEAEDAAAEQKRIADEYAEKLKVADSRADAAQKEAESQKSELQDALKKLEDLKSSGDDLPEEQGQQMMEELRKEIAAEAKKDAEAKLKKKIDQAAADKAEADKKLADAEAARKQIDEERDREQKAAADRIEKLQKQLAVASSEHVTIFKTHYENAQSCINSMIGCMLKLKEEPETREKLAEALRALCEKTIERLPASEAKTEGEDK
jgi:DNA repair exonuclease SbcCD ATPase subunit